MLPSDGKAGSGSRVKKCLPRIDEWEGTVDYVILDDLITKDVFIQHLHQAGQLIGIGTFRPINKGYWGRFKVVSLDWLEYTI